MRRLSWLWAGLVVLGSCAPSGPARRVEPDALLRVADAADRGGDPAAAEALLRRALDRDPGPAPRVALGRLLLRRGQVAEARRLFEQARAAAPADRAAQVGAAQAALAERDDAYAQALLEQVLRDDPGDVPALIAMGVVLDRQGRHGEAQERYHAALARDPANDAARGDLGLSLALGGRPDEAVRVLEPLGRRPGASPRQRQNLALALALAGRAQDASALLAAELGPDAARSDLNLLDLIRRTTQP